MVGKLPVRTPLSCVRVRVMTPLSYRNLASEYTWYCPLTHHRLGWSATRVRAPVGEPGVESELSASSDEANCAAVVGAGTSADLEASSDHETPKEPGAPSSCVTDLEGVLVNVRSSSDWEAVTTPDATFLGIALVARTTRDGVAVPRGTYFGSYSLSDPITSRVDGETYFEHPRE